MRPTALSTPGVLPTPLRGDARDMPQLRAHTSDGLKEYDVERHYRNALILPIYEGTSQLHTIIQAEYALGYREDRPLRCEPVRGWPAGSTVCR